MEVPRASGVMVLLIIGRTRCDFSRFTCRCKSAYAAHVRQTPDYELSEAVISRWRQSSTKDKCCLSFCLFCEEDEDVKQQTTENFGQDRGYNADEN